MTEQRQRTEAKDAVQSLGAVVVDDEHANFRVWSPLHRRVEIVLEGATFPLSPAEGGVFEAQIEARSGARYSYRLDGADPLPDPCSRWQPEGVGGDSALVDLRGFSPPSAHWRPPLLEELVLYELHVGTFTREGTFSAMIDRLGALRALGVRALELMPIATFPGQRGWGYDGLYTWAPHPVYGSPDALAALIAAAHDNDLGVILDVVYNHLGPGSERLTAFGPYLTESNATIWGDAPDFAQRGVREWAIQNAEMWIRDYHLDGLRLDATHAIVDDSPTHVMAELAARVHAIDPRALVISEMETGNLAPIQRWGHDAQWGDELHHAIHVLLTGEHEGYYREYGKVSDLAWALERPERERIVVCDQNHDQVGNRALGDRLHGKQLRLAAFCVLLSPGTPLLFMGEEYDERHPFQFFTDHTDQKIAEATRTGRQREFEKFTAFSGDDVPDPQAKSTFLASKLEPDAGDPETLEYYRHLLKVREKLRGLPIEVGLVDEERRFLRVHRGPFELAMNFSGVPVEDVEPWSGAIRQ